MGIVRVCGTRIILDTIIMTLSEGYYVANLMLILYVSNQKEIKLFNLLYSEIDAVRHSVS